MRCTTDHVSISFLITATAYLVGGAYFSGLVEYLLYLSADQRFARDTTTYDDGPATDYSLEIRHEPLHKTRNTHLFITLRRHKGAAPFKSGDAPVAIPGLREE